MYCFKALTDCNEWNIIIKKKEREEKSSVVVCPVQNFPWTAWHNWWGLRILVCPHTAVKVDWVYDQSTTRLVHLPNNARLLPWTSQVQETTQDILDLRFVVLDQSSAVRGGYSRGIYVWTISLFSQGLALSCEKNSDTFWIFQLLSLDIKTKTKGLVREGDEQFLHTRTSIWEMHFAVTPVLWRSDVIP